MSKVIAFIESRDNKIKNAGFETAYTASRIAGELGAESDAVLIGSNVSALGSELAPFGISKVFTAEDEKLGKYSTTAYSQIVAETAKQAGADIILISATSMGKDLAPRVAAKLEAGLATDCTALKVENGEIIATRPVYAGKAFIDLKVKSQVKMYSLRPNVFKAEKADDKNVTVEKLNITLDTTSFQSSVKEVMVSTEKLDVAEATIIVSGGRGMKGPEHFNLIEDLAKVLGAATGASRAVVDADWRPHSEQVGQTGKTVSPNLYIACGISGAIQHLAGMSSSKCIVAINKDKDAPIFSVADYGIVGDVFEVLPVLTEEFKKVLSN
jgi:electron transfer flavoprotein alpha subunit